jgi:heat shock protein HslJ
MSGLRGWFLVLVLASGCGAGSDAGARAQASPADPLPSWNDGGSKTAIVDFVGRVTRDGGSAIAYTAIAQAIQGTATYRERMALLVTSDVATPVLTLVSRVSILLSPVAGQTAPGTPGSPATPPGSSRSLEATYWKAIEVAGKQIRGQSGTREAHLVFQAGGRMSGSDGCNRLAGSYELKGDGIAFGQTLGTQMACQGTGEIEQGFRAALKDANRWRIVGDRLELLDAEGVRLAAFDPYYTFSELPSFPRILSEYSEVA